jgi:hypothetical protein
VTTGKSLTAGLIFFVAGLYLGANHLRSAPKAFNPLPSSGLDKLQNIADVDLEDYYRLKSMEERYAKADEILGKMMVIFLADLGLRVSQQAQDAAQNRAITKDHLEPSMSRQNFATSPNPPPVPENNTKAMHLEFNRAENALLQARDERSIEGHLRKVKIADLGSALRASTNFTNSNDSLGSLNGSFEGGTRVRIEGKSEAWHVHIDLAAAMQKSKLAGQVRIRLLKNGKVFSDSNSSGDNIEAFREFTGGSAAILIKAGPKIHLQAYYLKELDLLATNLYRRPAEDQDFEFIGSAQLKRSH